MCGGWTVAVGGVTGGHKSHNLEKLRHTLPAERLGLSNMTHIHQHIDTPWSDLLQDVTRCYKIHSIAHRPAGTLPTYLVNGMARPRLFLGSANRWSRVRILHAAPSITRVLFTLQPQDPGAHSRCSDPRLATSSHTKPHLVTHLVTHFISPGHT